MSDLDEWRSEIRSMTETQRAQACGHNVRVNGVCYECGDKADA